MDQLLMLQMKPGVGVSVVIDRCQRVRVGLPPYEVEKLPPEPLYQVNHPLRPPLRRYSGATVHIKLEGIDNLSEHNIIQVLFQALTRQHHLHRAGECPDSKRTLLPRCTARPAKRRASSLLVRYTMPPLHLRPAISDQRLASR